MAERVAQIRSFTAGVGTPVFASRRRSRKAWRVCNTDLNFSAPQADRDRVSAQVNQLEVNSMLSSATLFHFTRSLDTLKQILSFGFKPFYSSEDLKMFGVSE